MKPFHVFLLLCAPLLFASCTLRLTNTHPPRAPQSPGHSVAAANMIESGLKHLHAGRCAPAIHQFEKAVGFDPRNSEAHYWLGTAYYACADYPMARNSWHLSLEYSGGFSRFESRVYTSIAISFEAEGRFSDAHASYRLALSKHDANMVAKIGFDDVKGSTPSHGGHGKGKGKGRGQGRGHPTLAHKTEKEHSLFEPLTHRETRKH